MMVKKSEKQSAGSEDCPLYEMKLNYFSWKICSTRLVSNPHSTSLSLGRVLQDIVCKMEYTVETSPGLVKAV